MTNQDVTLLNESFNILKDVRATLASNKFNHCYFNVAYKNQSVNTLDEMIEQLNQAKSKLMQVKR